MVDSTDLSAGTKDAATTNQLDNPGAEDSAPAESTTLSTPDPDPSTQATDVLDAENRGLNEPEVDSDDDDSEFAEDGEDDSSDSDNSLGNENGGND